MRLDDFLGCFFPSETEPIHFRGFSPKEVPEGMREPVFGHQLNRQLLSGNRDLQRQLKDLNARQGLYFVPNSGGFKEHEILRCNAVFCEIDNIPLEAQHDLYDNAPYPPSLRVETLKSVHSYWLFPEELKKTISRTDWYAAQCGLIDFFKSDAGIKNPNRVMRLPFFNHLSWDGEFHTKRVNIHTFNPDTRFTIAELREAYPYTAPVNPEMDTNPAGNFDATLEGVAQELRRRISQHATYKIEGDGIHGTAQGICHNAAFGKTAIMVNLRTGAVYCHAGCDYWTIAGAFGLAKPEKANKYAPRIVKRHVPKSETGRHLLNYVYGER